MATAPGTMPAAGRAAGCRVAAAVVHRELWPGLVPGPARWAAADRRQSRSTLSKALKSPVYNLHNYVPHIIDPHRNCIFLQIFFEYFLHIFCKIFSICVASVL